MEGQFDPRPLEDEIEDLKNELHHQEKSKKAGAGANKALEDELRRLSDMNEDGGKKIVALGGEVERMEGVIRGYEEEMEEW